jgi:TetR/AcrR family transcriptional repressor of nem operon
MRYRPEHKSRTRDRIVDEARKAFLKRGHSGIGVDAIMERAGLTAGGFYSHFESKDALFALAIDAGFESSMEFFLHGLEGLAGPELIDTLSRRYLSRHHRDHIEEGCPMPPLAADAARLGDGAQAVFLERIRQLLATMTPALESSDDFSAHERALALLALYVGGLALSRVTSGSPLSNQLLLACRKQAREASGNP